MLYLVVPGGQFNSLTLLELKLLGCFGTSQECVYTFLWALSSFDSLEAQVIETKEMHQNPQVGMVMVPSAASVTLVLGTCTGDVCVCQSTNGSRKECT